MDTIVKPKHHWHRAFANLAVTMPISAAGFYLFFAMPPSRIVPVIAFFAGGYLLGWMHRSQRETDGAR